MLSKSSITELHLSSLVYLLCFFQISDTILICISAVSAILFLVLLRQDLTHHKDQANLKPGIQNSSFLFLLLNNPKAQHIYNQTSPRKSSTFCNAWAGPSAGHAFDWHLQQGRGLAGITTTPFGSTPSSPTPLYFLPGPWRHLTLQPNSLQKR